MLKKKTAILFLIVAYAILLAHNIIPHHHHDSAQEIAEHHHSHPEHSEDNKGLSHLLSHFVHSADEFTFSPNHNFSNTFSKQLNIYVAVLPDNFSLDDFLIPPLLHNSFAEQVIYISPHSHPSGLRAPPVV